MRTITLTAAALLGLSALSALAQAPVMLDPATGARSGHEPGVGDSLPYSNRASNNAANDTRSTIAPTLPASSIGASGTTTMYLREARASVLAGHTGAAQQSLEMAETHALDRSVPQGQTDTPSDKQQVFRIQDARRALGEGDKQHAIELIDLALAG